MASYSFTGDSELKFPLLDYITNGNAASGQKKKQ